MQFDADESVAVADGKDLIADVDVGVNAECLRVPGSILDSSGSS